MRQHVERDLVRINFLRHRLAGDDLATCRFNSSIALRARAGHGLVAGGKNPLHAERLVQRIQRHQRDRRRAIRIGDDAVVPLHSAALISGTTSGTLSSCRNALELSTTTQPALAAIGANSFEMLPPALNSAMSTPAKESLVSSVTVMSWP